MGDDEAIEQAKRQFIWSARQYVNALASLHQAAAELGWAQPITPSRGDLERALHGLGVKPAMVPLILRANPKSPNLTFTPDQWESLVAHLKRMEDEDG